jgi:hypothetical protein
MKRDELKGILDSISEGGVDSAVDRIMTINGNDINTAKAELAGIRDTLTKRDAEIEKLKAASTKGAELQKEIDEWKAKYETDTKSLSARIAERDYNDAVNACIAEKNIKFTSKAAENYFRAQLKEKNLEMKDGKLTGFDEFYSQQFEADKTAFVSDNTNKTGKFLGAPGNGGNVPDDFITRQANKFNEKYGKKTGDSK